jgi:hypothetical protein
MTCAVSGHFSPELSVAGPGTSAAKTKTIQNVAVSVCVTEGAVPGEDEVVHAQVIW